MTPTPKALRARLAALGVPDDRIDRVARTLAERLAALDVVPPSALERVAPATVFVPTVRPPSER